MNLKKKIDRLCKNEEETSYWSRRLYGQVDYLIEALKNQTEYQAELLEKVLDELTAIKSENGAITKADVLAAEEQLSYYVPLSKSFRLRMVSHAHIDMNWQWGFDETVGVTIDTFRTMLRLLEEYPQFIFTQSQASVYEIVEKYAPDILPAIRKYVKEGRWEVIASSWVEPDKNMINMESMARHILYTKQYLKQLLGLTSEQLEIDFEPDTFGHSAYIPEILAQGGVKYYYLCRGYDGEQAYLWRAPSGAEVLTLRDPEWYFLLDMDCHMAYHVPSFCRKNKTKTAVRFYGVGDHGGGPSRRDIERITDMQTWPLMPEIIFSTLHDFFRELEQSKEHLKVVEQELNCVFTGCYSSQARIKQANRQGEDHLYDCEALCAMARAMGCDLTGMPKFDEAWKKVLFNQFHDILPGSGIRETREHALGMAQEANAICLANANRALHAMGEKISTTAFAVTNDPESMAESAGAGFNSCKSSIQEHPFTASEFNIGGAGKSSGPVRPYTFFNTTQYERKELVTVTLWDWPEPMEGTAVYSANGEECLFDVVKMPGEKYWHHTFVQIAFVVEVPAFGYANYYVCEADCASRRIPYKGAAGNGRVHHMNDEPVVLQNERLKAVFRRDTMELISLWDKEAETEMVSSPSACFLLNDEQYHPRMSAWILSSIGHTENLNQSCFVKLVKENTNSFCKSVTYELRFRSSTLTACVSLAPGDRALRFSIEVDWNEATVPDGSTPQLQFHVPYSYESEKIRYDVPGGYLDREEVGHDVPAILYAAPLPKNDTPGIVLTTDCKYGYRAYQNALSITLFHSGYRPDKRPDQGVFQIELGLGVMSDMSWQSLTEYAVRFAHPLYCFANTGHEGEVGEIGQILRVSEDVRVTALKQTEEGDNLILRLTQNDSQPICTKITCDTAQEGCLVDVLENHLEQLECSKGNIYAEIPPHSTRTVCMKLKGVAS